MSSQDKRRYPRVHAKNVSARLNVADQSSPCQIQNISAGGIFIETAEALPVGMPVAVNLTRPGWARALRVSGRVVWAMAPRTAAKKGTLPGMRIKFDALSKANATDLVLLLKDLGASDGPAPLVLEEDQLRAMLKDSRAGSQPVSLKQIQARISKLDLPASPDDATLLAMSAPAPAAVERPSAPRRPPPSAPPPGAAPDSVRLSIQVQGLLMQLGELQTQLETRERELAVIRERLKQKEESLDKSDRERKAAELALQRLAMQLASRR